MFEFLAGFIVGINVGIMGIGVWSFLRMRSIQGRDGSEREPASQTVSDPAQAASVADWVWVT